MVCTLPPLYLHLLRTSIGCFRKSDWPWWKQPLPWWTAFFLVPLYSTCSSLNNLQSYRSKQLPIMVIFSCCSYTANRLVASVLPGRPDLVAAAGSFVIGILGNLYSRIAHGTAFTSMVTGVLFLVPVRSKRTGYRAVHERSHAFVSPASRSRVGLRRRTTAPRSNTRMASPSLFACLAFPVGLLSVCWSVRSSVSILPSVPIIIYLLTISLL